MRMTCDAKQPGRGTPMNRGRWRSAAGGRETKWKMERHGIKRAMRDRRRRGWTIIKLEDTMENKEH